MEKLNKWTCKTYRGVARTLGVSVWRIRYAVESGYLPAPSVVLKLRSLFSPEQVEEIRGYFEVENAVRQKTREEAKALGNNERVDSPRTNPKAPQ